MKSWTLLCVINTVWKTDCSLLINSSSLFISQGYPEFKPDECQKTPKFKKSTSFFTQSFSLLKFTILNTPFWLPFHSSFTDFLCLSPCSWQCAWSAAVFLALFFAVCPSFPSYPKIATTSTSYPIPSLLSVSLTFLPPFHFLPSVLWIGLCRAVSPWLGLPSSTSRSEGRPEQMSGRRCGSSRPPSTEQKTPSTDWASSWPARGPPWPHAEGTHATKHKFPLAHKYAHIH